MVDIVNLLLELRGIFTSVCILVGSTDKETEERWNMNWRLCLSCFWYVYVRCGLFWKVTLALPMFDICGASIT